MTKQASIEVKGRTPAGKHTFEISNGSATPYPATVDVDLDWQRNKTAKEACQAFGWNPDNFPALGLELLTAARAYDEQHTNGDGQKKDRFPLVTSAQLAATDYTPRAIVNECLFAGHPAFIGGMFKTCKTLFAIALAIAIATGRAFLNSFTVPEPMSVVYFSGEGGPSMIQDYARRIAAAAGIGLADVFNVHWCFTVPKLESLSDLDAMVRVIQDTAAEVIVIDNTTLALSGDDAGNVMKMGGIIGTAIRYCAEHGVTPVFVHHFKRARPVENQFEPGELLDLTQAGAAEIAGQWLLITRREKYDPDQPGEHRLWLNIGGRLGHGCLHAVDVHEGRLSDDGGRQWGIEIFRPEEVRKEAAERQADAKRQRANERVAAELESDRKELVKVATRIGKPFTERELRGNIAFQGIRLKRAIISLTEEGIFIAAETVKANKQTYPGWRLRGLMPAPTQRGEKKAGKGRKKAKPVEPKDTIEEHVDKSEPPVTG